jgi:hypothetical protein
MFPKPRDEHEDTIALLVVQVEPHTVAVSHPADEGKPAESVQPQVMKLAEIVIARLR